MSKIETTQVFDYARLFPKSHAMVRYLSGGGHMVEPVEVLDTPSGPMLYAYYADGEPGKRPDVLLPIVPSGMIIQPITAQEAQARIKAQKEAVAEQERAAQQAAGGGPGLYIPRGGYPPGGPNQG